MSDRDPALAGSPKIVAPVSRHLSVADLERSTAFYRDILGFDVRSVSQGDGLAAVAEAVCGPARIQLTTDDAAWNSTGELRRADRPCYSSRRMMWPRCALFVSRGGNPTELEKVNWIKIRMFEIRDPDGHILWFGQSFQQPSPGPDANRQLRKALPQLPVDDVPAAVAYYRDVLGFKVNYAQHDLGVMDRDAITILLIARTERHTGIGSCYVYIRDADALHAELVAKGADVQGEPVSYPWGLRDFAVLDMAGNQIRFGQTFE